MAISALSFAKIHASFRYMHHGSIPVAFHCSKLHKLTI